MNILLTGSSGFLGGALFPRLKGHSVTVVGRFQAHNTDSFYQKTLSAAEDFSDCLGHVEVVIHCAARAHIMKDEIAEPLTEYRKVNTEGTLNLARQAAVAGVKRFIFISSIKVNGEATSGAHPFNEQLMAAPLDPYGISKMEAEEGLRAIGAETGMEIVIIRPPLVYGPKVKANFLNLIKLADTVTPLPFGWINNQRSMVYVENLVDFIIKSIDHPAAANQTFLVSDGEDLSLCSLLSTIRASLRRPARLLPVPAFLFRITGSVTGKRGVVDRLVGDLQVDSSKARNLLGWQPPFTVQQGINATIAAYLQDKK